MKKRILCLFMAIIRKSKRSVHRVRRTGHPKRARHRSWSQLQRRSNRAQLHRRGLHHLHLPLRRQLCKRPHRGHRPQLDEGKGSAYPGTDSEGLQLFTCLACGDTREEIIEKLPDSAKFEDVPADSYFAPAVDWAAYTGITTGTGEGTSSPEKACTRAQVASFLYRAVAGSVELGENPFEDVVESDYFYAPVLWAVKNGVTNGVAEGTFAPHQSCTRAQIMTFLYRAIV